MSAKPSPADVAGKLEALAARLSAAASQVRSDASALAPESAVRTDIVAAVNDVLPTIFSPKEASLANILPVCKMASTRMLIKWDVFKHMPEDGAPIAYKDLAAKTGVDVTLLARFARFLVGEGTLKQVDTDKIAHTPASRDCLEGGLTWALTQISFDNHVRSFAHMPAYFDAHGPKEPTQRTDTILACAAGRPEATVWDLQMSDPAKMKVFMTVMALTAGSLASDTYDYAWVNAIAVQQPERALFVDVGGARGHVLKAVARNAGFPLDRCVLEDLPVVVDAAAEADHEIASARRVGMDFHNEQPVKGAAVYHLRRCLHDYGDEECVGILKHIADAMAADSRLLVVEQVLSDPPTASLAAFDLFMMNISGKERTLDEFRALAGRSGLNVSNILRGKGIDMSIMELIKA